MLTQRNVTFDMCLCGVHKLFFTVLYMMWYLFNSMYCGISYLTTVFLLHDIDVIVCDCKVYLYVKQSYIIYHSMGD